MKSNFEKVKEFSNAVLVAQGKEVQQFAEPMECAEVLHCIKMVMDEMIELLATVVNPSDRSNVIKSIISMTDFRFDLFIPETKLECVRQQVDALTDKIIYIYDCAARKAFPMAEIFDTVNNANLCKIVDGKVILEGAKVQKPKGWISPDKEQEEIIARAMGINV